MAMTDKVFTSSSQVCKHALYGEKLGSVAPSFFEIKNKRCFEYRDRQEGIQTGAWADRHACRQAVRQENRQTNK
jgi:hypothetical protein